MAIALPKSELSYVGPVREEQRTPIDLALERQWSAFRGAPCRVGIRERLFPPDNKNLRRLRLPVKVSVFA